MCGVWCKSTDAAAHLRESDRYRLPLQLRAAQRRNLVSVGRRSGDRGPARRVLPVRDHRRRLLAIARSRHVGHITPTRWPLTDVVAPAVLSVRDTIYLLPSTTRPLPILMLTQPETGRVEFYNRLLPGCRRRARSSERPSRSRTPCSPARGIRSSSTMTDTDRWFLYWNSSNVYPLNVIELDRAKQLAYKGTPRWLFGLDPEKHGWERFGHDHRDTTIQPFIEGAWMTKHNGRYYLQYGAPGTEYNVYVNWHLRRRQSARPIHVRPLQPSRVQAGRIRARRGTRQHVSGSSTATGGTPARRGSA